MNAGSSEIGLRRRSQSVLAKPFPRLLRQQSLDLVRDCPWYFVRAVGARLTTADGRELLDLEMGRGPSIFGYCHPALDDDRHDRLWPANASLFAESQIEVAEAIVDIFPGAQKVAFGRNGSDACTAAVRTARALTGRAVVLSSGFHGFHDWCAAYYPWVAAGIPVSGQSLVHQFDLNDLDGLAQLADLHGGDLAAIVLEPAHHTIPDPDFLLACRTLASRHGALLIFDEVVTAFRLHVSGAQGLYGITPDLTCLGKAMANGDPISALAGSDEAMAGLDRTYYSMTFQNDNRIFGRAKRCLSLLHDGAATAAVRFNGEALRRSFDDAAMRHGLPHRAMGFSGRLDLHFEKIGDRSNEEQRRMFAVELLKHDVLPVGSIFACATMTDADLRQAAAAFDAGMAAIAL